MTKEIRINPIRNGTVIDHLEKGSAYKIIGVLGLSDLTMTAAMSVESRKLGRKDVLFIEGRGLTTEELDKIALIGKGATINIIKNSEVAEKRELGYPESVIGIMRCINPKCITNEESLPGKFGIRKSPLEATCYYCETRMGEGEIIASIKK